MKILRGGMNMYMLGIGPCISLAEECCCKALGSSTDQNHSRMRSQSQNFTWAWLSECPALLSLASNSCHELELNSDLPESRSFLKRSLLMIQPRSYTMSRGPINIQWSTSLFRAPTLTLHKWHTCSWTCPGHDNSVQFFITWRIMSVWLLVSDDLLRSLPHRSSHLVWL